VFEVTGQASENNLIVQKKVDRLRTFPHFLDFENTQLSFKPVVIFRKLPQLPVPATL
jgi:hypothetical protein